MRIGVWLPGLAAFALLAGLQTAAVAAPGTAGARPVPAEVRVNQVGYAQNASKVAFVMLPGKVASVGFTITGASGTVFRAAAATT